MSAIRDRFHKWIQAVELKLAETAEHLYPMPSPLHEACRYALAGQGKRIRPLLAMASAEAVAADPGCALIPGVVLEMIHTYSLVHDDLPSMDNDDLRRGRATTHKVYGEAMGLLVGDALLTDAFTVLASDLRLTADARIQAVQILSSAAGGRGMVWGQALDMSWTGQSDVTQKALDEIHLGKTAALIAASCALGGIAGGARAMEVTALQSFGRDLGLVFQIIDDLLDEAEGTGKSQGKDQASGKLTYLRMMSRTDAEALAERLTRRTLSHLEIFGERAEALRGLAELLLKRKN